MAFHGYNDWTDPAAGHAYYSTPYYPGEPNPIPFDCSLSTYSDPINYASYDYYNYSVNQSEANYCQPKYLQYDPSPPYQAFFPSHTKFTVSYSNVELGVPEFQEYDPTPYDGGYDQAMTYGKPLPPSDLTCYPPTLPQPDALPLENFSFDSIASPYGRDDDIVTPARGSKPADAKPDTAGSHGDGDDGKDVAIVDVEPRNVVPILTNDYPSYQHQNPYGSGLEAMDICESLFGYWPCLAKKAQQQQQQQRNYGCQVCDPERRIDPWKSAADYLFGSPLPDDYDNYHHHHSLYQSDQIS